MAAPSTRLQSSLAAKVVLSNKKQPFSTFSPHSKHMHFSSTCRLKIPIPSSASVSMLTFEMAPDVALDSAPLRNGPQTHNSSFSARGPVVLSAAAEPVTEISALSIVSTSILLSTRFSVRPPNGRDSLDLARLAPQGLVQEGKLLDFDTRPSTLVLG
jgi:hypothetical protein